MLYLTHDDNGSNVNDYPPSDTAVLSPDNLKVGFWCPRFYCKVFFPVHEKYMFKTFEQYIYMNMFILMECFIYNCVHV